jgi:multiple sugar transport system permease protein
MTVTTPRKRPAMQWAPIRPGAPSRARGRGISDRKLAFLLIFPTLILLLGIFLVPTILAATDSFFRVNTVSGERQFVGFDNFVYAVTSSRIIAAFGRTALWTICVVVGQVVIGLALALLLNQKMRARSVFRTVLLFPYVAPAVVVALVWRYLTEPTFGLINYLLTSWGIIDAPIPWLASPDTALWSVIAIGIWKNMPFMLIMFLGRLQSLPGELVEAVRIDGGNSVSVFRYVILPWLAPVVIITALLRAIWSFNEFDVIYLLTSGGPVESTTTLPIVIRNIAFTDLDSGQASAVALLVAIFLCIVAAICFAAYSRFEKKF